MNQNSQPDFNVLASSMSTLGRELGKISNLNPSLNNQTLTSMQQTLLNIQQSIASIQNNQATMQQSLNGVVFVS